MSRYVSGLFNLDTKPAKPLREIWDVNMVLAYFDKLPANKDLPFMLLVQKTVLLILISTMRHHSEIMGMDTDNYYFQPNAMVFPLDIIPKNYSLNTRSDDIHYVVLRKFSERPQICPVLTVQHFIKGTAAIRSSQKLFITTQSPFRVVSQMTLHHWILTGLFQAVVDVYKYTAKSTRHVSSSKAYFVGVSVDLVMSRARWANVLSFIMHYNLPIVPVLSGSHQCDTDSNVIGSPTKSVRSSLRLIIMLLLSEFCRKPR